MNCQFVRRARMFFALRGGLAVCLAAAMVPAYVAAAPGAAASSRTLIPRSSLFATNTYSEVRFSPDGAWISYLRPVEGVNNIWIAPAASPSEGRVLTKFSVRGPDSYRWSADGAHILVMKDNGGEEVTQISAIDVRTGAIRDLGGDPTIRSTLLRTSKGRPGIALIANNARDRSYPDVYEVDLTTGERKRVYTNAGTYTSFVAAPDLTVSIGIRINENGSATYELLQGERAGETLLTLPLIDLRSSRVLGLSASGMLRMIDSRGTDKANLVSIDIATGKVTRLAEAVSADIIDVLTGGETNEVLATLEDPKVKEWKVRSPDVAADFAAIEKEIGGQFLIEDQTPDDRKWLIQAITGNLPDRFFIWDRDARSATMLFSAKEPLQDRVVGETRPVVIPSRDGKSLVSYLTLPPGLALNGEGNLDKPVPMVLLVHGGPWLRDAQIYDEEAKWLADRGYAVLAVNFRGSTGFGKAFIDASHKEWTGKMHDDLIDAVNWAIGRGIADRSKTAIYGLSYGGYSTLVGLSFTPDVFACGVDLAGPSNLPELFSEMPDWWAPQLAPQFRTRVNDPRTKAGAADLWRRSPMSRADRIRVPLLVTNGANDPRVLPSQSDQIVNALKARNHPVTYIFYPDEGHVYEKQKTKVSFHAVAEHFLANCLGGAAEPFGNDLVRSDMEVRAGAAFIPGLEAAIDAAR